MSKLEARKRIQSLALQHQRLKANNVSDIFQCIDENKLPSPELAFRLMYDKGKTKSPPRCEFEGEKTFSVLSLYLYLYLLPTSYNYISWYLRACC